MITMMLREPVKCNYNQYTSGHILNNKLINQFERTITTTVEHDTAVTHIVGVIIKKVLANEKVPKTHIKESKDFYEQTIDDINRYKKQYDDLYLLLKKRHEDVNRMLDGNTFSFKKDIKKLRDK